MTKEDWIKTILGEARQLGHAEVKSNQKTKQKAADELCARGDLIKAGTMSKGGNWYKLSEQKKADYASRGYAHT